MKLVIYRSRSLRRNQRWHWKLVHANGKELCRSSEGYANRKECADIAHGILNGNYRPESVIAD